MCEWAATKCTVRRQHRPTYTAYGRITMTTNQIECLCERKVLFHKTARVLIFICHTFYPKRREKYERAHTRPMLLTVNRHLSIRSLALSLALALENA